MCMYAGYQVLTLWQSSEAACTTQPHTHNVRAVLVSYFAFLLFFFTFYISQHSEGRNRLSLPFTLSL